MKVNRHSIIIVSRFSRVFDEIVCWGESYWWPKGSLMRFERRTQDLIREGTFFRQKVCLPFGPSWNATVTKLTDSSITRVFSDGMFEGGETVSVIRREGAVEVVYEMCYRIKGIFNRLMWRLIFNKLHDQNIEMILRNLKIYLEQNH